MNGRSHWLAVHAALAVLIVFHTVGCGRVRIYNFHQNSGSAPDLVFIERSTTNYLTLSNYLVTTNFLVATSSPLSTVQIQTNAVLPSVGVLTNAGLPAESQSSVLRSPSDRNTGYFWLALAVVLLVIALFLLWRTRTRGEPLFVPKRQPRASIAGTTLSAGSAAVIAPETQSPEPRRSAGPHAPEVTEESAEAAGVLAERIAHAEKRTHWANAVLRAGLVRRVAELLMDKFVLRLISQRERLLHMQRQTRQQITYFDERLANVQRRLQERISLYEQQIAELKERLALKEAAERERLKGKAQS